MCFLFYSGQHGGGGGSHCVVLECAIENYFGMWIISLIHVSGFQKSLGR